MERMIEIMFNNKEIDMINSVNLNPDFIYSKDGQKAANEGADEAIKQSKEC